jgi:hypothetical protein
METMKSSRCGPTKRYSAATSSLSYCKSLSFEIVLLSYSTTKSKISLLMNLKINKFFSFGRYDIAVFNYQIIPIFKLFFVSDARSPELAPKAHFFALKL